MVSYAQKEASYWYFGRNAGLQFDFERNTVTALTDGSLNTLEGCTSISDSNGSLLFYSDGSTIWNRNHQVMVNGTGLKGDESSTSSGLIVPKPQDPNFYYLFTVDEPHHNNSSAFPNSSDGDGVNDGLMYSRININDDNGFGAVDALEKNIPLVTYDVLNPTQVEFKCSEKITAVRADDCSSFWVITHFVDSFYAFKVDTNGVSTTPVISTVGPVVPVEGYRRNALGYMKASPDGTKLVVAHQGFANIFSQDAPGGVYLFDFNNDTGEVSNSEVLYSPNNGNSPYGVEFSAENRKVYASIGFGFSGAQGSQILQWDLEASNIPLSQQVITSANNLTAGALQLGIDRKIYRATIDFQNFNSSGRHLGVIENPELTGAQANYNPQGVLLDINGGFQNLSSIGLPPFIQSLFNSQIDIIRNGESTTELNLCNGDSYTLVADNIPGADYFWFRDDTPLTATGFELVVDSPGLYEVLIEPNNGECPIEGSAVVGVFDVPIANSTTNIQVCDLDNNGQVSFDFLDKTLDIMGSQNADSFEVVYFTTEADALSGINSIDLPFINTSSNQIIYARIQNSANIGCFELTSFTIEMYGTPEVDDFTVELCDEEGDVTDGIATVDFNQVSALISNNQPSGVTIDISYHESLSDAESGINALPLVYTNTTPDNETIFIRLTNTNYGVCRDIATLDLKINPAPSVSNVSIFQCDEDGVPNGITLFNLNEVAGEISNNEPNRSVEFFLNQDDAVNNTNPINGSNYENASPLQIVTTKVTNTLTGCSNFGQLLLEVSSTSANNAELELCDTDGIEDGFMSFNLALADPMVLEGLPSGLNIEYFPTYEDALLETNTLPAAYINSTVFNEIIYARVENANACYGISEVSLRVLQLPDIETDFETVYCLNNFPEPITLNGGVINDLPNNYLYEWSTGETTTEILVNETGTYTVKVFNTQGCFKERTIQVLPSNVASITNVDVTDGSQSNSIVFSVSGEGDYEFSLESIDGPYQDQPFFDNLPPDLYTLFVRDKNGCGIINRNISVIGFPRFFTPNGDGVNDFWQIKGISSRDQLRGNIFIFDRFGKLLVELDPTSMGWNGYYNGNLVPSNDYWFLARLQDGRVFKSHFTLKR